MRPHPPGPLHRRPPPAARRHGKRNDAAAAATATAAARPPLLAHAQLHVPGRGFYGVGVYESEDKRRKRAEFYRHVQGNAWELVTGGTFDAGRLYLATDVPPDPDDYHTQDVIRGLNQALLATRYGADRAARIAMTSQRFHGDRPPVGPLADPFAEATRVMLARSACQGGAPGRPRKGPDPAVTARAMFEGLCFQPDGRFDPAPPGSGCDQYLSAVRGSSPPSCASVASEKLDCPRRQTPEDIAMARQSGGRPPYETSRPHEPGAVPCCWFHPTTQARLVLHREVRARVMARPGATEREVDAATVDAERAHPLHAAWEACDAEAREASEGDMVMSKDRASNLGNAKNKDATMSLFIALYHAMQSNAPNASSLLAELQRDHPTMWDFSLDEDASVLLTEHAHPYAHETHNAGYIAWAHRMMSKGAVAGRVACTVTDRAQASRARYKESMKAARPSATRRK